METVACDTCRRQIKQKIERRPAGGDLFDVGFECPTCKTWYHGYWDSTDLEAERENLNRLRDQGQDNPTIRKIYNKRLKRFNKIFDQLQGRAHGG